MRLKFFILIAISSSTNIPSSLVGKPSGLMTASATEVNIKGHNPKTQRIRPVKKPFFSGNYFQVVFKIG